MLFCARGSLVGETAVVDKLLTGSVARSRRGEEGKHAIRRGRTFVAYATGIRLHFITNAIGELDLRAAKVNKRGTRRWSFGGCCGAAPKVSLESTWQLETLPRHRSSP